jgi:hypothetical protein
MTNTYMVIDVNFKKGKKIVDIISEPTTRYNAMKIKALGNNRQAITVKMFKRELKEGFMTLTQV